MGQGRLRGREQVGKGLTSVWRLRERQGADIARPGDGKAAVHQHAKLPIALSEQQPVARSLRHGQDRVGAVGQQGRSQAVQTEAK